MTKYTAQNCLIIAAIVIALGVLLPRGPATGQVATPGVPVVPLGYCQLTSLGSSTALTACSGGIPTGANAVILRAEAQALRYRDDAVAPTSSVGMPMAVADAAIFYQGTLTGLRFIEQTSGGKLDVSFYRAPQ